MATGSVLFLLGVITVTRFSVLPPLRLAWLLLFLVPAVAPFRRLRWPVWYAAGFLWALLAAHHDISQVLDHDLEKKPVVVEGRVASLPERNNRRVRFEFLVDRMTAPGGAAIRAPGRIRLNWYRPYPEVVPGQRLRLTVRLKRPHGFQNPGGFDYEGWLFRRSIRATGYVVAGTRLSAPAGFSPDRLRYRLRQRLHAVLGGSPHTGLILALSLGDRSGISRGQWRVLTRTGTNHLLAISGLHIGLVAGIAFALTCWLWPLLGRAALWLPAPRVAAIVAFLAAAVYALLAGLTVPTQRALIMVAAMLLGTIHRRMRPVTVLGLALLGVLLFDPFSVLSPGFWLSFAAVAVILFALALYTLPSASGTVRFGRIQLSIFLGLAPLLAVWFRQIPLLGMLANAAAIPWISFVSVPLILSGTLLTACNAPGAGLLLALGDHSLDPIWSFLQRLAAVDAGVLPLDHVTPAAVAAALVGSMLLLLPRATAVKWLGALWLLPLLFPASPALPPGSFRFTLLDVGQGLAAVVRTRTHVLTYDTGPAFGPDFNTGSAVVLPFLRQTGVRRVDIHVQSHADSDHIGGLADLLAGIPVGRVLTSVPASIPFPRVAVCRAGQHWRWDGVRFQILSPPPRSHFRGNNRSCVLRVSRGRYSVLLPGDIEHAAERSLLDSRAGALASTILVAPHHGSDTSSGRGFVRAVSPRYVLFASGYLNRYHFPKRDVMKRYREAGAMLIDTAHAGAIRFRVNAHGVAVTEQREVDGRFWQEPP
jgi:competence protein ComEC